MSLKQLSSPNANDCLVGVDLKNFLVFFESYFADIVGCLDEPIKSMAEKVIFAKGKRIRPSLVYLFGSTSTDSNTDKLLKASAILELVHIATLVHDDILDDASHRRGAVAIHNDLGRHTAILLGDALFSFALEMATEFDSTKICQIVASATRKTCSGEINQTYSKGDFSLSFDDYIQIIRDKTGELFSASCMVGSLLANGSACDMELASEFGLSLGINYQMYDDVIDFFGNPSSIGKSLGTDFNSGKITLPILTLLECSTNSEKDNLSSLMVGAGCNSEAKSLLRELFCKYDIKNTCLDMFDDNLKSTISLARNMSDPNLCDRILDFVSSFRGKINSLKKLRESNFLAI